MSDTTVTATTTTGDASQTSAGNSTGDSTASATGAAMGDAGKQALDRMKADLVKAKDELAELRAANGDKRGEASIRQKARDEVQEQLRALEEFKAKAEGREAEYQAAQKEREAEQAALSNYNGKLLRLEIKAAAKGVLTDPQDAYKFLDLDSFEVGDDGVDEEAIKAALDDLIKDKPYLAVQDGKRFKGDADGGTRKESVEGQLTQADVTRLAAEGKHEEIETARAAGRLNNLLGIK